jgi:acyl-CoA dehydrogenase
VQVDFAIPQASRELASAVRKMVESQLMPHDALIEEQREIPPAAMTAIRKMGLFGSHTPKQYGGLGLDMLGNCLVIEEMARAHIAYFYTYSMKVHIASKGIELHGSKEQRMRWLPRLASGEAIGSYALTEENAGSDASGIETSVTHSKAHYVLNGSKRYITNAPIADIFTVFAAHPQSKGQKPKISAFVVERSTPGLSIGRSFSMAGGLGAHHAEIVLKDVAVPKKISSATRETVSKSRCNASMQVASIGPPIASARPSIFWT